MSQISAWFKRLKTKQQDNNTQLAYPENEVIDEDEINESTNLKSAGIPAPKQDAEVPMFSLDAASVSNRAQRRPASKRTDTEDSECETQLHQIPTSGTLSDVMEFESSAELPKASNRPKGKRPSLPVQALNIPNNRAFIQNQKYLSKS